MKKLLALLALAGFTLVLPSYSAVPSVTGASSALAAHGGKKSHKKSGAKKSGTKKSRKSSSKTKHSSKSKKSS